MKIITKAFLINYISNNKIDFKPTQLKLCVPIINRIYKKMKVGIKFSGINVENNMICDGHHRYMASIIAKFPLEFFPGKIASSTVSIA